MKKLIAFNLYTLKPGGGHQPATEDRRAKEVYLASEVHDLLRRCRDNLYHPHEPELID